MPQAVLISDTNIWIDLHRADLLEAVFELPYQFVTTEFVFAELRVPAGTNLEQMGLQVMPLDGEAMSELLRLRQTLNNSSLADVSCYYIAQVEGWPLLTNDGAVRKAGEQAKLDVRGVLWVLDQLYEEHILCGPDLAKALQMMLDQGAWLPSEACETRMARWQT
ncbi:nucleotide-binding protein [Tamilnaduibacter salinus]|uniref:Nucleotide-binding protein n=1 Tax=Tamilnaduibacter salinus TaxID=1484056 RepID=A0A2A2I092_9GAMM|nr:nucleotide-binding protein [Tamilnaduibacter salinus]PAV24433.1 nucleotide-binding protein [Tamilnaduibacter salinus]